MRTYEADKKRLRVNNSADKRGEIIKLLEQALALADELGDGDTAFLIEGVLDEARSQQQQFRFADGPD